MRNEFRRNKLTTEKAKKGQKWEGSWEGKPWVKNCEALPGIHRKSGRIFNRALVNLGE